MVRLPADWQQRTAAHLDERAIDFIEHTPDTSPVKLNVECAMSCHTTQAFMIARTVLVGAPPGVALGRIRARIEARVIGAPSFLSIAPFYGEPGSDKERESRGSEAVLNAATLALADRAGGHVATPVTIEAFARLWEGQRADGGWDWLDFGLEPWETRADWGATLVAMAVATLPRSVTDGVAVREHVVRLTGFLRARFADRVAPMAFHDRIMLLRAATALPGLLPDADRVALIAEVAARQRPDGGWSLAAWGVGEFANPAGASDAYATGHALLALCEASGQATAIDRGLAWLAAAWQHDGSWPGHSVNGDDPQPTRFMSDAATAYAAMAIVTCEQRRSPAR